MNPTAIDRKVFVDDVVAQLTGGDEHGAPTPDLREQMQRAAEEFDEKTANAFARDLLAFLCDDPGDVRRLEALLVLGLAHPRILDKHRISLSAEGRRLAVLLERGGEDERARSLLDVLAGRLPNDKGVQHDLAAMMRRTGQTDALVERYLRRAEEAIEAKKPLEAIPWLQEVLLHDRTRRDVARMIKELREQASSREVIRRRLLQVVAVLLVLGSGLAFVLHREYRLHERWSGLPTARASDLGSLQARLASVDRMLAEEAFWLGMFRAEGERTRLRADVLELEARAAEVRRKEQERREREAALVEEARQQGLERARRGEFAEALAAFERALDLAPADWEHRERVSADVAALHAWQEGKR